MTKKWNLQDNDVYREAKRNFYKWPSLQASIKRESHKKNTYCPFWDMKRSITIEFFKKKVQLQTVFSYCQFLRQNLPYLIEWTLIIFSAYRATRDLLVHNKHDVLHDKMKALQLTLL